MESIVEMDTVTRVQILDEIAFPIILRLLGNVWIQLSYLPTPPLGQDMTQGQFLSSV